ncbi:MAG: DUF2905 domain-containing protein [Aureliella sp.]
MQHPAWILVIIGLAIAAIGALWMIVPGGWLGRLPGDIVIERENFHFYFPLTTCILISLLLSGIAWLVRYLVR